MKTRKRKDAPKDHKKLAAATLRVVTTMEKHDAELAELLRAIADLLDGQ